MIPRPRLRPCPPPPPTPTWDQNEVKIQNRTLLPNGPKTIQAPNDEMHLGTAGDPPQAFSIRPSPSEGRVKTVSPELVNWGEFSLERPRPCRRTCQNLCYFSVTWVQNRSPNRFQNRWDFRQRPGTLFFSKISQNDSKMRWKWSLNGRRNAFRDWSQIYSENTSKSDPLGPKKPWFRLRGASILMKSKDL